jgi:hypothetical protein
MKTLFIALFLVLMARATNVQGTAPFCKIDNYGFNAYCYFYWRN